MRWVLQAVFAHFTEKYNPKQQLGDLNPKWFGFQILASDFKKMKRYVPGNNSLIGWFGYDFKGEQPSLSVWIYCKGKNGKISSSVRAKIFAKLKAGDVSEDELTEEDDAIRITIPGHKSRGDKEWFIKVLSALN